MLELHKIITASDIVMFSITFLYFMSEVGREECSKLSRMIIFLVSLAVLVLSFRAD